MNESVKITINTIDKNGFFIPTKVLVPKNIAEMAYGLNNMYRDNILEYKPHLTKKRNIYNLLIKTRNVDNNIIKQIKEIAIKKNCKIKEDKCYSWLTISNEEEDISNYFD